MPLFRSFGFVGGSATRGVCGRLAAAIALCALTAGCSSQKTNYSNRTFFRPEYGLDTHGRKTWFDHLVEVDPGGIKPVIADDYDQVAPARIAVLPFVDHGTAQFVVDKIPLTHRSGDKEADWAWTDANRLRRRVDGYLSEREFLVENLIQVDQEMKQNRIFDEDALNRVSPEDLGKILGVDAVVYGTVTHYESYYAGLVSAWQVGLTIRMVSTHDGRQLFAADGSRWAVDMSPAFDPIDIAINSAMSLLELRDVTLARAEEETAREIVLRIPHSDRLEGNLIEEASGPPVLQGEEDSLQAVAGPTLSPDMESAALAKLSVRNTN